MLNLLELEFEMQGEWHIGVIVNNDFLFYTTENTVAIPLRQYPADVQLVFTGKSYHIADHANNYCKIKNLYLNKLYFPYLIHQCELCSDHSDYKSIPACNLINLNGVWKITINSDTVQQQLRQIIE